MINYILGFTIYFGGMLILAKISSQRNQNRQNSLNRSTWMRNWKRSQEQLKIGFLMKLRGEI